MKPSRLNLKELLINLLNRDPFYGFVCDFRWFRRAIGGKWEKWIVDWPICGEHWFEVEDGVERPFVLCRCNALKVENYD